MISLVSTKKTELVKLLSENGVPFSVIQKALRKRDVKVNGVRTGENVTLNQGDEIVAYVAAAPSFSVLYEDENILAVDKRKGVGSEALVAELSARGKMYFIHRLDTNTDGVMLFAKNSAAAEALIAGFRTRAFEKYYRAEVYGFFEKESGVLRDYLVKDADASLVRICKTRSDQGASGILRSFCHRGRKVRKRKHKPRDGSRKTAAYVAEDRIAFFRRTARLP